jgi:transposase-like protein
VRLVEEVRPEHASEWAAIESVASNLGIGSAQTVHNWVRKAEVDAGTPAGDRRVWSLQGVALRVVGLVIGRDAEVADELTGGRRQIHLGE